MFYIYLNESMVDIMYSSEIYKTHKIEIQIFNNEFKIFIYLMRIYNAKSSQVSVPLTLTQKIIVPSYGISESFMPNPKFLSLIVTSFDYSDLALIVSGPIEMTMCSETPCAAGFVVNSVEEAIERFTVPTTASMKCAAKVQDPLNKEPEKVVKPVVKPIEEPVAEPVKEEEVASTPPETEEGDVPEEPAPKKVTRRKVTKKKQ